MCTTSNCYNKYIFKNMQHANTNKSKVMKHKKHTHTHTHMDKAVQSTYSHMVMPAQ
jgi:hypothetical protein